MNDISEIFSTRLDKAMKLRNMKSVELHEKTGISESLLSKYLSGNAIARQNKIFALSKVLDVNPAWLMGYDVPATSNTKTVEIPILRTIDPNISLLDKRNIIDYTTLKIKPNWDNDIENYFAIASLDDDMLPVLGKGDLAFVHIQDKVKSGQTALIFFKETKNYSIKKIVELKKGIELYSMNPTIREIHVDNINDLIIIGRIVKSDNESYFE